MRGDKDLPRLAGVSKCVKQKTRSGWVQCRLRLLDSDWACQCSRTTKQGDKNAKGAKRPIAHRRTLKCPWLLVASDPLTEFDRFPGSEPAPVNTSNPVDNLTQISLYATLGGRLIAPETFDDTSHIRAIPPQEITRFWFLQMPHSVRVDIVDTYSRETVECRPKCINSRRGN